MSTGDPCGKSPPSSKHFSTIAYSLLHIRNAAPHYKLIQVDENFLDATNNSICSIFQALIRACGEISRLNADLGLNIPLTTMDQYEFVENSFNGRLVEDRVRKESEYPGKTAVYLATTFLNLAEESILLKIYKKLNEEEYESAIPEEISEEKLRLLENKFHNLQSLYDTLSFRIGCSGERPQPAHSAGTYFSGLPSAGMRHRPESTTMNGTASSSKRRKPLSSPWKPENSFSS